jgi:hypothetical protein
VTDIDPAEAFRLAVHRLAELEHAVASQESQGDVAEAMIALRLAVVRAYGGRRVKAPQGHGARKAILRYLQERCGEWVYGDELAAISGIGEWARRVRELRVEEGFDIEEEAGMYRLRTIESNVEKALRWRLVGEIRQQQGTSTDRVIGLLIACVGGKVTGAELDRVAGSRIGARATRELRNLQLWPIESSGDAADLAADQYRLVSAKDEDRTDPYQRLYPEDLRHEIFRRDRYSCWICGRDHDSALRQGSASFYLQIRHLDAPLNSLEQLAVEKLLDKSRLATSCRECLRVTSHEDT